MQALHGLVDLTNEQYHGGPGISSTKLHAIAPELGGSPLNYWDQHVNPDREPREEKHCFAVGDGTHKLVLEPGTFEKTYAVGFDKTAFPDALDTVADLKKACSERGLMVSGTKPELADRLIVEGDFPADKILLKLQQKHEATMAGRIPIPAGSYKNMLASLQAIAKSEAAPLLAGAETEQSFFWTDENGVLRKCRTDAITSDGQFVLDLKTTDDVSKEGFGRTIAQRRYHVAAAWYLDILYALYGDEAPSGFAFVAAQKTRPYDVAVHYLTERQIHLGRLLYRRDLALIMECERTGHWPGVARGEFIEAELPAWEMNKISLLEGALL